jgi:hypothetical protein
VQGKGATSEDKAAAGSRAVIGHPEARSALFDWLAARGPADGPLFISLSNRTRGERLSRRSLRQLVKASLIAAGVVSRRKSAHSLRHTAATNALRGGADLDSVQAMCRHKSGRPRPFICTAFGGLRTPRSSKSTTADDSQRTRAHTVCAPWRPTFRGIHRMDSGRKTQPRATVRKKFRTSAASIAPPALSASPRKITTIAPP